MIAHQPVDVVQQVDGLGPELRPRALGDGDRFAESQVQVERTRPGEHAPLKVAHRTRSGLLKRARRSVHVTHRAGGTLADA